MGACLNGWVRMQEIAVWRQEISVVARIARIGGAEPDGHAVANKSHGP